MRTLLLPLFTLPLAACTPPPSAPEELDELVGFLFAHITDDEPALLEEGVANLDTWLIDGIDETAEGYEVDNIEQETIDSLENLHATIDGNLSGAAVGHISVHDTETLIETPMTVDSTVLYPDSYTFFERTWDVGPDCFIDRSCDFAESVIDNNIDYSLLQVEVESRVQYRRVDFERGDVILERTWLIEEPVISVDWLRLDAQFFLWAILPDEDGTARTISATWFVYTFLDAEVDEGFALNIVVNSMANTAEDLDQWISDEAAGLHEDDGDSSTDSTADGPGSTE